MNRYSTLDNMLNFSKILGDTSAECDKIFAGGQNCGSGKSPRGVQGQSPGRESGVPAKHYLWSPYVIGQTIIFSSCFFFLLLLSSSSFFFFLA